MPSLRISRPTLDTAINLFRSYGEICEAACPPSEFGLEISRSSIPKLDGLLTIERSPERKRLADFLQLLSDEELQDLQVLIYIGQGAYSPDELEQAYRDISISSDREQENAHMLDRWQCADYLADAFDDLNRAREI